MSKSSKQNLNTKSSTEAKLVGASDYLPYPIWAKKFLEAQGFPLTENTFYQDNQSTAANRADLSPGTSTFATFLSRIDLSSKTLMCNTALLC